jgi:hypothetical protein
VATIPDAGGARYAPRGVVRALLRFAVLSGLVIVGWLLGSGVGHATEDLGQPGTGVVQPAGDPADITGPSDDESNGQFGLPPTVTSTVKHALSQASVPRLPVAPVDVLKPVAVLKPVVRAVGVSRPLAHVVSTVARPLSAPTPHGADIRSPEPAHELAAVSPAAPVVRATSSLPHAPVCAVSAHATVSLAEESALGGHPAAPIPTSPPDSTTAPCMIGSAAGGGGTRGSPELAVNEGWANTHLASTHGLGSLSASDVPRSLAEQPSTSPD